MDKKRYFFAAVALLVFVFFYEWLVHGMLLVKTYHSTPEVWRSYAEMKAHLPLQFLFQLVMSFWLAFVFTRFYPKGGVNNGIHFGLYFGVFAGIINAFMYLYLPVSSTLGVAWFINGVVEGLIGGAILGAIYHNKK